MDPSEGYSVIEQSCETEYATRKGSPFMTSAVITMLGQPFADDLEYCATVVA